MRRILLICVWLGALALASADRAWAVPTTAREARDRAILIALKSDRALNQADDRAMRLAQTIDRRDKEIAALRAQGREDRALIAKQGQDVETLVAIVSAKDSVIAAYVSQFRNELDAFMAAPGGVEAIVLANEAALTGDPALVKKAEFAVNAVTEARQRAWTEANATRQRIVFTGFKRQAAQTLLAISPVEASIARYEEITKADPGNAWDWITLARLYGKAGRVSDQARAASRATELTFNEPRARAEASLAAGRAYTALRRHSDANGRFRTAYEISRDLARRSPDDPKVRLTLAQSILELTTNELLFDRLDQTNAVLRDNAALTGTGAPSGDLDGELSNAYLSLAYGRSMRQLCYRGFTAVFPERMPFDQFNARCIDTTKRHLDRSAQIFRSLREGSGANIDYIGGLAAAHIGLAALMTDPTWFQAGRSTADAQAEFAAAGELYAEASELDGKNALVRNEEAVALIQYERFLRLYRLDKDALSVNREIYQLLSSIYEMDTGNHAAIFEMALALDRNAKIYFAYTQDEANARNGVKLLKDELYILGQFIEISPEDQRAQLQYYSTLYALAHHGAAEQGWQGVAAEIERLKSIGMWPDNLEGDARTVAERAAREKAGLKP